jgi:uncharacterized RDD family membrane protein YckC
VPPISPGAAGADAVATPAAQGRPAGFWIRLLAALIDGILLGGLMWVLWPAIFGEPYMQWNAAPATTPTADGPQFLLDLAIRGAYFVLLTSLWGTTIGKRVLGMWVVGSDGRKISIVRALGRYLGTIVSALILLIGYIMVAFRRDKRALHDLIADTWVVIK